MVEAALKLLGLLIFFITRKIRYLRDIDIAFITITPLVFWWLASVNAARRRQ